jgi:hypothetical protein
MSPTSATWVIVSIIVTWAIILLGVGINWGVNREQIRAINRWIEGHETYSRGQDKQIIEIREAAIKMAAVEEQGAKRLDLYEKSLLVMMGRLKE